MRPERDFRCVVTENNAPCKRGMMVPMIVVKDRNIGNSGYICRQHLDKGYCWMSGLLSDPNMEIPDPGTMALPKRANDLWLVKGKSNPAVETLRGYGIVGIFKSRKASGEEYIEDVLLLPLEDAKDPKAPLVERKDKTVVGGFAEAPPPKDD